MLTYAKITKIKGFDLWTITTKRADELRMTPVTDYTPRSSRAECVEIADANRYVVVTSWMDCKASII
jgi:hypothetical protein